MNGMQTGLICSKYDKTTTSRTVTLAREKELSGRSLLCHRSKNRPHQIGRISLNQEKVFQGKRRNDHGFPEEEGEEDEGTGSQQAGRGYIAHLVIERGVGRVEGKRVFLQGAFGSPSIEEILGKLQAGDVLSLDNSDYIAVQTYHRHQVPSPDYHAWDQFRDENGEPLYPQRGILQGPMFSSEGPGCYENGRVNCKFIIVAALNDEQAYPWQADWYRRKVETEMGKPAEEVCRLYYFENATHGEPVDLDRENHMTSYEGGLRQSLLDLSDWVQKGIEPLPSSVYTVEGGLITPAETAKDRRGIQPTVSFGVRRAGDEKYSDCVHVKAGETVEFLARGAVPDGAGALTFVDYSFEDEPYYPNAGEWTLNEDKTAGTSTTQHIYNTPGTYFACVRVKSEKSGSREDFALQMRNIGRTRVVVEEA